MARKIPAPFTRDSLTLGGVERVWADVPAQEIRVGDTLAGLGLVKDVSVGDGSVTIRAGNDHTVRFDVDEALHGFVVGPRADG